jgi:hypothetical protein
MGPFSQHSYGYTDPDALTVEDYARGKRNYDAATKGTRAVPWYELSSWTRTAWARAAHATPAPAPLKRYAFDVQHVDNTWQTVLAPDMLTVVRRYPQAMQIIRKES